MTASAGWTGNESPRLGVTFLPDTWSALTPASRRRLLAVLTEAGVAHLVVPDHISFNGGWGCDGMVSAAEALAADDVIGAYISVYLLGLRHPVAAARQISTLAQLHPGRLRVGVGVGGEDRAEPRAVGVDPATRGRRTDEALRLLRHLLAGEKVTSHGEFFSLEEVQVLPAPTPAVPLIVGGRSNAALRRAGRLGDGYIGLWASPRRFAEALAEIDAVAEGAGRTEVRWRHGMTVWCGLDRHTPTAVAHATRAIEGLYGVPFENFARWVTCGPPEAVAEAVLAYAAVGAGDVNLVPHGASVESLVEAVADICRFVRNGASLARPVPMTTTEQH